MGFFSDIIPDLAPIIGSAAGGAAFGPVGGVLGGAVGGTVQEREQRKREQAEWDRNLNAQREFAQHGIRWKVADAKAAGIHPLVALGANTAQFSGMVGGSSGPDYSGMGQDISRAITSTATADERNLSTLAIQGAKLDLQGKALDNQIKQSQLTKLNQVGPAFPGSSNFIAGQGDSGGGVVERSLERTRSLPGKPEAEHGSIPDMGWAKTKSGIVPIPSKDVKERIEDNMPHEWSHFWRNNVAPNWGGGTMPPKSALPKGAIRWEWSHMHQEYQPYYPQYKFERRFQ